MKLFNFFGYWIWIWLIIAALLIVVIAIGTAVWSFFAWDASTFDFVMDHIRPADNLWVRIVMFVLLIPSGLLAYVGSLIHD